MAGDHETRVHITYHAPQARCPDRDWVADVWQREWHGDFMVTRGRTHRFSELDVLVAVGETQRAGAATYRIDGGECELISLNAVVPFHGVGSALLRAVETAAGAAGASRVVVVTTNDNLGALRFYQRRGYRLAAVYPGAVDETRRLKPSIPLAGADGIPLRDELELEKRL